MATIFQTTFSNAFSWMKMYEFRFDIIPALDHILAWCWPAIVWTNDGLLNWCIYVSLRLNDMNI